MDIQEILGKFYLNMNKRAENYIRMNLQVLLIYKKINTYIV